MGAIAFLFWAIIPILIIAAELRFQYLERQARRSKQ